MCYGYLKVSSPFSFNLLKLFLALQFSIVIFNSIGNLTLLTSYCLMSKIMWEGKVSQM